MDNRGRALLLGLIAGLLLTTTTIALAQVLPPGGSFIDDDGNPHEGNIEAIAAADITKGCNPPTNDKYCPDAVVTRGAMAAFLVRALDLTDNGGGNLFTDDDDSVFEDDIDKLGYAGITKGCNPPTNDRFCPSSPVLRDQMASFLARALDLDPIVPPPTTTTTLAPGEFEPFTVSGSGHSSVAVSVPADAVAVVRITNISIAKNFIVWAQDADYTFIDLLVNEIGVYSGARPVNLNDFLWLEPIRHLDITSSGSWSATFEPLSMAELLTTKVSGNSDDVIRVSTTGAADFTYTGNTNFKVWARNELGASVQLVNAIGDYSATHVIPDWAEYLDIIGIGSWTIEYA